MTPSAELEFVGEFGPYQPLAQYIHGVYVQGRYQEALDLSGPALVLVTSRRDHKSEWFLRYLRAVLLMEMGQLDEALDDAVRLVETIPPETHPAWHAKALAMQAEVQAAKGDMTPALDALAAAAELLELEEYTYSSMSASMAGALALRRTQLFEEASHVLIKRALPMAMALPDPMPQVLVLQECVVLFLHWAASLDLLEEFAQARETYLVAATWNARFRRAVADSGVQPSLLETARVYDAFTAERLGDVDLAQAGINSVKAAWNFGEFSVEHYLMQLLMARLCCHEGNDQQALIHLDAAQASPGEDMLDVWKATVMVARAMVFQSIHGHDPAVDAWRELARVLLKRAWVERLERFTSLRKRMRVNRLEASARAMYHAAHQDPLTKLGNRRYLAEYIEKNRSDLCVVFADIDHFKRINDRYSHRVGDLVLQRVAASLADHCRPEDCLVRYAGDEFLVLINGDAEAAVTVAHRMREALVGMNVDDIAPGLTVTASIGVSGPGEPHEVLHLADLAMHGAKSAGRNRVSVHAPQLSIVL